MPQVKKKIIKITWKFSLTFKKLGPSRVQSGYSDIVRPLTSEFRWRIHWGSHINILRKVQIVQQLSGHSKWVFSSMFKSLCCFGGLWASGTFASLRCCVWPWPRTRAPPPAPGPGWSATVSDLRPPPRHPPWSLRTLLYQTGTGRPHSDGCHPSSSHPSRLPALGRRSRSGTPERKWDQDQPVGRVLKTSSPLVLQSPRVAGTPPWCDAPPGPWLWLFCPLVDCSAGATGRSWRTPAFLSKIAAGAPRQRAQQRRSVNSAVN